MKANNNGRLKGIRHHKTYIALVFVTFALLITIVLVYNSTKDSKTPNAVMAETPSKYKFTDSLGNEITVPYKPQKTAVLFPSYGDIWINSGGSIDITVEETIERGYANDEAVIVGTSSGKEIDLEKLIAEKPDFVILSSDFPSHIEVAESLRNLGIPAALFQVDTFLQYLEVLDTFAVICDNTTAYEEYGEKVEENIALIKERALSASKESGNPRLLLLRAYSTGVKVKGKDSFVDEILKDLGGSNIADSTKLNLDDMSIENILSEDPEYIFVMTMGDSEAAVSYMNQLFVEQPAWNKLQAIKNDKYYVLSKDLFQYKPNSRWDEAYKYIFDILYSGK